MSVPGSSHVAPEQHVFVVCECAYVRVLFGVFKIGLGELIIVGKVLLLLTGKWHCFVGVLLLYMGSCCLTP